MSELPPSPEDSDEVDALYRRASAHDAGRPSESVRRAVLEHAAQLAASRAAGKDSARGGTGLRATRQSWWRPAAFGTLAAAALAGFLVIPQYLGPDAPVNPTLSPAPAPAAAPAPTPAPAPAASSAEYVRPQAVAPEPRTADRKKAPDADEASQNVVVTAAKRMPAEGRNSQAAQNATREPRVAGAPSAPAAQRVPMVPSAPSAPSAGAPMAPSALDSAQPAARSARSVASGTAALSYSPPPAAAAIAPAPQAMDPGAQLRRAAEMGDVGALRALLDPHAAVDARDAGGRTALMLAALHGRTEAVEALLSAGADPNAADVHGMTPLQAALAADQPAIAAALRRAGAR